MQADGAGEPVVGVRLTTSLDAPWKVTEAPIELPTRLSRYGLSEVVNTLLGGATSRPFDFLLEGELLRTSLGGALKQRGLSGEATVTLEYIPLLAPPNPRPAHTQPDWVSCVRAPPTADGSERAPVLSGCYDGAAYLWDPLDDASSAPIATLAGHTAAIKACAWMQPSANLPSNLPRFVTASKDHTLRTWNLTPSATGAACACVCVGHADAVEAVAASPGAPLFISGGWDAALLVWNADRTPEPAETPAPPPKRPKRSKRGAEAEAVVDSAGPAPTLGPVCRLAGHGDAVTGAAWPTAALAYTCGWDGTVREWDIAAERCTVSLSTSRAATSIDVSLAAAAIATGHCDHGLRVWDARLSASEPVAALKHRSWVSGVAWSPSHAHQLASSCYDGVVRLWDIRSASVPLHELPAHADKALCVAWDTWQGSEIVISGGADGQLRRANLEGATA